ncbi:MAG: phosphatase PAP2 family protein [Thermodesulfovibrionales bacterium]|nr:phosphatase PAP2 family protein [Thermodesulfovibrionales bacterium]
MRDFITISVFYLAVFFIGITLDFYYDRDLIRSFFYTIKPFLEFLSFIGLGGTQFFILCTILSFSFMRSLKAKLRYKLKAYVLTGLMAVVFSGILVQVFKHIIGRPRPRLHDLWGIVGPTLAKGFDSLPSGHTTTSFALAVVTARYFPKIKFPVFLIVSGVAIARVGLGSHYPSDVSAGIILGMIAGTLVTNRLIKYEQISPLPKKMKTKDKSFHYSICYSDEKVPNMVKDLVEMQSKIPSDRRSKGLDATAFSASIGHEDYQIHHGKWTSVIKVPGPRPLYFKVFYYNGIKQLAPIILYPTKSYSFFIASNYLSGKGFNAPKVIAYGKIKKGIFLKNCFLFYEEVSGMSVSEIFSEKHHRLSMRALLKGIALKLNELHGCGIYHGDLRPQNISIQNEEMGFIDLDKVKITNANNVSLIIRDLAKLNSPDLSITVFSRLRFFAMYLKNNAFLWQKRKAILKRILEYSSKVYTG